MSFALVALALILISLTVMKYRSALRAALVIAFLFSATTAVLLWGLNHFADSSLWFVAGKNIDRNTFLHLITALYAVDLVCAIIIVNNHRQYRKVNRR